MEDMSNLKDFAEFRFYDYDSDLEKEITISSYYDGQFSLMIDSEDFPYAFSTMSREEMIKLRDGINKLLL